ncbi:MAG: superinfection immunity protein [Candidatus Kaiserbacteria bacterium]|nr:superinfection immunity protein [Candidatus Kaiserbacteria bacterium]
MKNNKKLSTKQTLKIAAIGLPATLLGILAIGSSNEMAALLVFAIVCAAYFLPTIWACKENHHNKNSIAVINFFLGWTFIGWVVALAMAGTKSR